MSHVDCVRPALRGVAVMTLALGDTGISPAGVDEVEVGVAQQGCGHEQPPGEWARGGRVAHRSAGAAGAVAAAAAVMAPQAASTW